MVKECGMHRLSDAVIATKRERNVAHSPTYFGTRKMFLDPFGPQEKIQRILTVFFHAGGDRKDIRIKDDVLRIKFDLIDEDSIASFADLDPPIIGIGL